MNKPIKWDKGVQVGEIVMDNVVKDVFGFTGSLDWYNRLTKIVKA